MTAVTSVITKLPTGVKRLQIVTQPHPEDENKIAVLFHECDEELKPTSKVDIGSDDRDHETYHRELRKAAAEKNELITSHSTDPEWNPEGYVFTLDEYIYNGSM
jgi:hypothetical protein